MTLASGLSRADADARQTEPFDTLFGQHYAVIYAVLFRLTGERAEAEDLAQETFLRLYDALRDSQRIDNVGGWLYRVATRLGYNALRAARRRAGYEQAAAEPEQARTPDPAEELAHAEQRRLVRTALAQLPPQQAQLLVLRHSGLSYKELAGVLGVAPASVGTLLARAEQAFGACYVET
ncbi:MAG: sigma-70 family RNA polymerase sigma factor [Thermoflexales bacterium]|nr:sigma-70 family RNA polymerase sigma factor [Thermoflexales bacterium]